MKKDDDKEKGKESEPLPVPGDKGGENRPDDKGGEVKKPTIIASRIIMEWKQGVNHSDFDIEPLVVFGFDSEKSKAKYTMQYIARFFDFYMMVPGTNQKYDFTADDVKLMTVKNMAVEEEDKLQFSLACNGTDIVYDYRKLPAVDYDVRAFLESKIVPNRDNVSRYEKV